MRLLLMLPLAVSSGSWLRSALCNNNNNDEGAAMPERHGLEGAI
jgi:hypothetical protein